jgi:hypothetical protein
VWVNVTSKSWFEAFVMLNILATGVVSGLDLENAGRDPNVNEFINVMSSITTIVFTLECVLKIVAEARRPLAYFQDPEDGVFNTFDFTIVALGYVFMLFGENSAAVGALRMLRLVRLLTFIKGVQQLRVIVAGVIQVHTT